MHPEADRTQVKFNARVMLTDILQMIAIRFEIVGKPSDTRWLYLRICSGPTTSSPKQEMLTFLSKAQSAADISRQIIGP